MAKQQSISESMKTRSVCARSGGSVGCALVSDPINLKRPDHILEFHLPHPFQRIGKAILDLIEDLLGNTNAACSGQWYDASSDVDAIANHVVSTTDNIAGVNSDTNLEIPLRWIGGISLGDRLLDFNPALHCRQGAGKFDQKTISDCFDFRPLMLWKD